jgi:hypothetical protein
MKVVTEKGNSSSIPYYISSYLREAVKEAVMANIGDVWIYILTCVIGEESVSGVIWKCVGGSRYRVGILGGLQPAEVLAEVCVCDAALRPTPGREALIQVDTHPLRIPSNSLNLRITFEDPRLARADILLRPAPREER